MKDCKNINDIFSALVRLLSFMTHYPDMVKWQHWQQVEDGLEILNKLIESEGGENRDD